MKKLSIILRQSALFFLAYGLSRIIIYQGMEGLFTLKTGLQLLITYLFVLPVFYIVAKQKEEANHEK